MNCRKKQNKNYHEKSTYNFRSGNRGLQRCIYYHPLIYGAMKKTTIAQIAEAIANKRYDLFNANEYDRVTDLIFWAWENWPYEVLKTYYESDMPEEPTYSFIKQWVETELENVPENYTELITSFKEA